jgi:hypothetical protein
MITADRATIAPVTGAAVTQQNHAAFDYDALPQEAATALRQSADRIRALGRKQTEAILDIGKELKAAKDTLPHGQFTPWVTAEFGMTDRTALNYMYLADWAADKPEIISDLPPTAIYLLAAPSTPAPAKEEIVSRVKSGEIVRIDDVKKVVGAAKKQAAEAKRAEREVRRKARLSPPKLKAEDELIKRGQKQAAREEAQRERKARERTKRCERVAAKLRERFGEDLSAFLELAAPKDSPPLLDYELLEQLR